MAVVVVVAVGAVTVAADAGGGRSDAWTRQRVGVAELDLLARRPATK